MIVQEKRILLIGEDFDLAARLNTICTALCDEFVCHRVSSEALHKACNDDWDVVLLGDSNNIKVTEICEVVKEVKPFVQIVVLSEIREESTVAEYLFNGADDCVTTPFSELELEARIFASMRRSRKFRHHIAIANLNARISRSDDTLQDDRQIEAYSLPMKDVVVAGDLKVYPSAKTATVRDKNLLLTQTEFLLLSYLIKSIGIPCSKDDLLRNVLGYDSDEYISSLHSHINRLRRKLEMAKSKTTKIETLWRFGYKLAVSTRAVMEPVTSESKS